MYERRIYRQRKSGLNAATVLLALAALGLAFLILRPGSDNTQQDRTASESTAAGDPVADASSASDRNGQQLSGIRQQVAKASQDLSALRSETEQMRAQLSALRQQRELLAGAKPPAPAPAAGEPAPGVPQPVPAAAPAAQPAVAAVPALPAQAGVAGTPAPATLTARPTKLALATDAAQPAAVADKPAAGAEHDKKMPHHAHNAHGYLLTARDELQSGDASRAEEALERAETWALNNSGDYRDNLSPTEDPLVSTVEGVRAKLRAGRTTSALRMLESILAVSHSARAESSALR